MVLWAVRHHKYRWYGDNEFSYDYLIVQLNGTSMLQHVSLLRNKLLLNETAHPYLMAMGLGSTWPDRPSMANWLRYINLAWVSNEVCEGASHGGESYRSRIDPLHVCTFKPGKDSCNYDSGSPIILTTTTTDDRRDGASSGLQDFLVAQVSWGMKCANENFPAVNARLRAVLNWVDETVCAWSIDPPVDFGCSPTTTATKINAPDAPTKTIDKELRHFPVGSVDSSYAVLAFLLAVFGTYLHWKQRQDKRTGVLPLLTVNEPGA